MNPSAQLLECQRTWAPPKGLARSLPRSVQLTAAGTAVTVVAAVMLVGAVVAGVGLGLLSKRQAETRALLRAQGTVADGVITAVKRTRGKSESLRVDYRFTVSGATYQGHADAPHHLWDQFQTGQTLPVRFLPSNPAVNHPASWDQQPLPWFVAVFAAASLVMGGGLIVPQVRRQWRLLAEGRAAPAIVTRLRKVHTQDQRGTVIYYEFLMQGGTAAAGKSCPVRHPPALGGALSVLYDPDNPRRNAPYPFKFVRLEE